MDLEQFLREFGLPLTLLVVIVVTGSRGIWVWGRELLAANTRADEWKKIALKSLSAAEKVVGSDESVGQSEVSGMEAGPPRKRRRRGASGS